MLQRVLLATFSIRPVNATAEALIPPFSHFDPFGTEFREPGRVSHPDPNRAITKILPAFAGAPDVHARVGISPFQHLYQARLLSLRKQNLQYLSSLPLHDKRA